MSVIDRTFVKKSFNASAETYDRHAGLQNRMGALLLRRFCNDRGSAARILDIGMGTGNLTLQLGQRFPEARVHGCDLALNMLERARQKQELSDWSRLIATADAEQLPYKPASFDLVASSFTYQWLDDWTAALREVQRVLVAGGLLIFSAFGAHTFYELRRAYEKACRETGYTRGTALQLSTTRESIAQALAACGFEQLRIESLSVVEHYGTVNDLIRSIKGMGARNASARRNKTPGVRKIWKRMVMRYEQDFGTGEGIPSTFEIILGTARKPSVS